MRVFHRAAKIEVVRRLQSMLHASDGARDRFAGESVELAPAFRMNPEHQKRRGADALQTLRAVRLGLRCAVNSWSSEPQCRHDRLVKDFRSSQRGRRRVLVAEAILTGIVGKHLHPPHSSIRSPSLSVAVFER